MPMADTNVHSTAISRTPSLTPTQTPKSERDGDEDGAEQSAITSTMIDMSSSVTASKTHTSFWRISAWAQSTRIGSGIIHDVRRRAPYYVSDWTDAWNYRVIPAVVLIFFAK